MEVIFSCVSKTLKASGAEISFYQSSTTVNGKYINENPSGDMSLHLPSSTGEEEFIPGKKYKFQISKVCEGKEELDECIVPKGTLIHINGLPFVTKYEEIVLGRESNFRLSNNQ